MLAHTCAIFNRMSTSVKNILPFISFVKLEMAQYKSRSANSLYLIVVIVVLAHIIEAKRIYIEPHPSTSKRSADIASKVGKITREFPELGGYVVEVRYTK